MRHERRRFLAATALLVCLPATLLVAPSSAIAGPAAGKMPRIAIIIDDLGYGRAAGLRAVTLPGPVACAVLPRTPQGARLAEAAYAEGKDVLLHLPLQPVGNLEAEPGDIVLDMTRAELARTFDGDLASIPHVVGVNTHRGSLITRHPGHMHWLMEEIGARPDLFFVDSYTTAASVALQSAREAGIAAVRRDVFLDPDEDSATVEREFARLKRLARRRGMAVGIGHPHPATLALLERELPGLASEGIELVSISEYVRRAQPAAGTPAVGAALRSAAGSGD